MLRELVVPWSMDRMWGVFMCSGVQVFRCSGVQVFGCLDWLMQLGLGVILKLGILLKLMFGSWFLRVYFVRCRILH